MNILIIAKQELIRNLKDIKMIAILILFPILTIFILGNVQPDTSKISISVGYVNLDTGNEIGTALDHFLDSKDIKDKVDIVKCKSLNQVNKKLNNGYISCYIYLPKNLSEEIRNGNKGEITVGGNSNVDFIDTIINTFTSNLKTIATSRVIGRSNINISSDSFNIHRISTKEGKGQPDTIDYYSVVMLLEMLIIGAIFGVFISTSPQESDINVRLYSLPVGKVKLMIGRTLGSIGCLFLSASTTLLFSKYVYGANWSGNILLILGVIFIYSAIIVGLGMIIGRFVSSYTTALIIVMLLMIIFGIISGAVTPESSIPGLNYFIPNYHAQLLIFGTIYSYPKEVIIESGIGLFAFLIGVYGILIGIIRRDKNAHI